MHFRYFQLFENHQSVEYQMMSNGRKHNDSNASNMTKRYIFHTWIEPSSPSFDLKILQSILSTSSSKGTFSVLFFRNDISKESLEHLKESSYFTSASFRIKLNGSLKSLLTELVLRRRLNALDIGREVKCDENVIENVKTVFVQKQFNLLVIEKRKLLHVALRCWKKNPEDVVGKCVTIWPEINAMRGDVKRKLKPALEATNFYRYVSSLNKLGLLRPSKIYNFAKAGEHGIYVNFECFSKPDNIEEIEYAESSVEVRFYFY
ncbi:hypothetical protein QR680_007986 [Steinernema hermaphroditum]|uniref:Uncharacterized protein n=1 Tax=Steinernema hermaphroditum TaxID=289476 RepID=A0AA39IEW7_9BILA|nr:hypothetical protein QR680_007986 [Steinernema hermaphroditum]